MFFDLKSRFYLSGGMIMGGAIALDAALIFNQHTSILNQIFSIVELFWFFYMLYIAYHLSKTKRPLLVPLSYIIYYTVGFFLGSYWLAKNANLMHLPDWYVVFALLFGLYYFFINRKMYQRAN